MYIFDRKYIMTDQKKYINFIEMYIEKLTQSFTRKAM